MESLLLFLVFGAISMFITFCIIRIAIDGSETAKNIKEIKEILREHFPTNEINNNEKEPLEEQ